MGNSSSLHIQVPDAVTSGSTFHGKIFLALRSPSKATQLHLRLKCKEEGVSSLDNGYLSKLQFYGLNHVLVVAEFAQTLQAGVHEFPFTVTLPHIPPSVAHDFWFSSSSIHTVLAAYLLEGTYKREVSKCVLNVIPGAPLQRLSIERQLTVGAGCCWQGRGKGEINLEVKCDKPLYNPGDRIRVRINWHNTTTKQIDKLRVSLVDCLVIDGSEFNDLRDIKGVLAGETVETTDGVIETSIEIPVKGIGVRAFGKYVRSFYAISVYAWRCGVMVKLLLPIFIHAPVFASSAQNQLPFFEAPSFSNKPISFTIKETGAYAQPGPNEQNIEGLKISPL